MAVGSVAAGAYAATQSLLPAAGSALSGVGAGGSPLGGAVNPAGGSGGFGALLESVMKGVGESGRKAETQALAATGGKADLVEVVTAVAESETALQTLVAVRDRMIAAYEDVMRMQI